MRQWNEYKERVLNRVRLSCETNIWPFDYRQFKVWLSNFKGNSSSISEDEQLALYLLDRLVVRTKSTALSGYSRLIAGELRQSWINKKIIKEDVTIDQVLKTLSSYPISMGVLMAPVTFPEEDGDSGPVLFRALDSLYNTNANAKLKAHHSIKAVVYIDDLLGTGEQFCKFMEREKPFQKYPSAQIYYCPLLAYKDGIKLVEERYSQLNLFPVEVLGQDVSPFQPNEYSELIENYLDITIEGLREQYLAMFDRYCGSNSFKEYWEGYHNLAMSVVFEWGCPNNSLGILRMESSKIHSNWEQLFRGRS